ncbi:MAG: Holliday junction resolvase RuvX [Patescibacteria group bacterium]|nr:Holliday junction resolvase RuvX [Patescibacteria group bacterium]
MILQEKILGVDYGSSKIGLALADLETKIATPYKILIKEKDPIAKIKEICQRESVGKVIVGVPLGLKGIDSKQLKNTLEFVGKLKSEINLEIIEQDEKMTSIYAQKLLRETRGKKFDDSVAAMLILQSYLDELR